MKKPILILLLSICTITNYSQETGTFTDTRDGKEYKYVLIGKQIWMAEDLAYRDSSIFVYKNKTSFGNNNIYLYNIDQAYDACPDGWYLPELNDWKELINYLGQNAGGKLKSITGWISPNKGATNEVGFNAMPNGMRIASGRVKDIGKNAFFWTNTWGKYSLSSHRKVDVYNVAGYYSTEDEEISSESTIVYRIELSSKKDKVKISNKSYFNKREYSIRCVSH